MGGGGGSTSSRKAEKEKSSQGSLAHILLNKSTIGRYPSSLPSLPLRHPCLVHPIYPLRIFSPAPSTFLSQTQGHTASTPPPPTTTVHAFICIPRSVHPFISSPILGSRRTRYKRLRRHRGFPKEPVKVVAGSSFHGVPPGAAAPARRW